MEYIYTLCVGNVCELGAMFFLFLFLFSSFLCLLKWQILAEKTHFTHTKICCSKFFFELQYFAPYDTSLRTQFELILGIEVLKPFLKFQAWQECLSLCVSLPFRMALKFILELFGSFQFGLVHHLCTPPISNHHEMNHRVSEVGEVILFHLSLLSPPPPPLFSLSLAWSELRWWELVLRLGGQVLCPTSTSQLWLVCNNIYNCCTGLPSQI